MDEQIFNESNGHVLLIDLENCPSQINQLQGNLTEYTKIVICHAQSNAKIPLGWVVSLSVAISAGKLIIMKMEKPGKNSADFGICFFAGSLMQELPKNTHFTIVSNDTDLDHAVYLLKAHGRSAERVGIHKNEISQNINEELNMDIAPYCNHLLMYAGNRPAKLESLMNSIKSKYGGTEIVAESIYKQLLSKGCIQIKESKVIYLDDKIKAFRLHN